MKSSALITHVSFAEALKKGSPPAGNLAVPIFSHGSLVVELYSPIGKDRQKPHARDEIYLVARGHGLFFDGEERHAVEAGSFLFVAAGQILALKISHPASQSGGRFTGRKAANQMADDAFNALGGDSALRCPRPRSAGGTNCAARANHAARCAALRGAGGAARHP